MGVCVSVTQAGPSGVVWVSLKGVKMGKGKADDQEVANQGGAERRAHSRHKVYGGNAEIESVHGRGRRPGERARIVNWSRGGFLMKVPSPRRRFVFQKLDPVMYETDTVTCTLRLPPKYADIIVSGDVVYAKRDAKNPDLLEVAVQFDDHTQPTKLAALAHILEPKARTVSGRLKRISAQSARISAKLSSDMGPIEAESTEERSPSRRSRRSSSRQQKASSGRQKGRSRRTPKVEQ
jgi:hypothetical protein